MEDIIKLKSRYGNKFYLKRLPGEESKSYLLELDSPIIRTSYINNKCKFTGPLGGPMIV